MKRRRKRRSNRMVAEMNGKNGQQEEEVRLELGKGKEEVEEEE